MIISPLVILLGEKIKKTNHIYKQKNAKYFSNAQKILNDRKINKRIKELNLETIPNNIFKEVEKLFQNEVFNFNKIKSYSPCLYNLICWEMGVIEYHRYIRNFCLNYYDMKILSKEEIIFCGQMDNINIMYNKLKYYTYKFCKQFEKEAVKIMETINTGILEENEESKNIEENEETKNIEENVDLMNNNENNNMQKDENIINEIENINNEINKININEEDINKFEDSIENINEIKKI